MWPQESPCSAFSKATPRIAFQPNTTVQTLLSAICKILGYSGYIIFIVQRYQFLYWPCEKSMCVCQFPFVHVSLHAFPVRFHGCFWILNFANLRIHIWYMSVSLFTEWVCMFLRADFIFPVLTIPSCMPLHMLSSSEFMHWLWKMTCYWSVLYNKFIMVLLIINGT